MLGERRAEEIRDGFGPLLDQAHAAHLLVGLAALIAEQLRHWLGVLSAERWRVDVEQTAVSHDRPPDECFCLRFSCFHTNAPMPVPTAPVCSAAPLLPNGLMICCACHAPS